MSKSLPIAALFATGTPAGQRARSQQVADREASAAVQAFQAGLRRLELPTEQANGEPSSCRHEPPHRRLSPGRLPLGSNP